MEGREQRRDLEIGEEMGLVDIEKRNDLSNEYDTLYEELQLQITGKQLKIVNKLLEIEGTLSRMEDI